MAFQMWKGNRSPSVADTITIDGLAVDLSSATVKFKMRPANAETLRVDSAATIVSGPGGAVRYDWTAADVDTVADNYKAWWEVTLGGTTQDTPEFDITFSEHAPTSSEVPSPVATDGSGLTTIYKGDSYSNTVGRALTYQLQVVDAPDLTGLTLKWRVTGVMEKTMTVVGEDAAYVELTSAETTALSVQTYAFEIEATISGSEYVTLLRSSLVVNPDISHIPQMPLIQDYITLPQLAATLNLGSDTYANADASAAITSASRAIDNECNRRFGLDAAANSVRYYTATDYCSVEIDDCVLVNAIVIDTAGNGSYSTSWTLNTHYDLLPYNAAAYSEPYTGLSVRTQSGAYLTSAYARTVRVTGQFGWPAVPAPIVDATTILAHRLLKRKRESPYGVVGLGVDSTPIRLNRTDPDVYGLIEPYTRRRMLLQVASLEDIRMGLKANIDAAFPDAQCTGYLLAAPTNPSFEIELDPEGIETHQAARNGVEQWHLIVRAVVSDGLDVSAQKRLDEFIDTGSVRTALESDQTLGGAAQTLQVIRVGQGGYRRLIFGDNPAVAYLTCEWAVEVYAAGT